MKQEYNRLLDRIAPEGSNEEFTKTVLRKAMEMKNNKKEHNIRLKRPVIAVCAVVAALTLGVTSAAAAGIIEFDKIFGCIITAENEAVGNAIMGNAENVTTSVSDSNYKIRFNGVTGNDNTLIANMELYRVDGTSVTEHFANPYDDSYGFFSLDTGYSDIPMERDNWITNMNSYFINEEGNLEIYVELNSDCDISESNITLKGKGLYPIEPYFELLEENDVSMWTQGERKLVDNDMNEVELNTQSVEYLSLEWEVSFEYIPSEFAVNVIHKDDFSTENPLTLEYSIGEYIDEGLFAAVESEIVSVDLTNIDGSIIIKSDISDYIDDETNRFLDILIGDEGNPVMLIKKDGSEVLAFVNGAWYEADGNIHLTLKYISGNTGSWYKNSIAVDLTQIEAISINGYEYRIA